jgi:hypothetical protein
METISRLVIRPDDRERISQLLSAETQEKPEDGMIDPIFKVNPLGGNNATIVRDGKTIEVSELYRVLSPEKRKDRSKRACQILFQTSQATDMFRSLDDGLSKALKCSWGSWELDRDSNETLQRTCHILERLPSHPPPMMVADDFDPYRDLSVSHLLTVDAKKTWANLKVSTLLNRNIIRMAIYTTIRRAEKEHKDP